MYDYIMNLVKLERSQSPINQGDFLRYAVIDGKQRLGRVIATNVFFNGLPAEREGLILIYLYSMDAEHITDGSISPSRLLIPPLVVTRRLWTAGWFVKVASRGLNPDEVLPVHQFWDNLRGRLVDHNGNQITRQEGPIGSFTVAQEGAVSIDVSRALGLPYINGEQADPVPLSLAAFFTLSKTKI